MHKRRRLEYGEQAPDQRLVARRPACAGASARMEISPGHVPVTVLALTADVHGDGSAEVVFPSNAAARDTHAYSTMMAHVSWPVVGGAGTAALPCKARSDRIACSRNGNWNEPRDRMADIINIHGPS